MPCALKCIKSSISVETAKCRAIIEPTTGRRTFTVQIFPELQTRRLLLSPLQLSDAAAIQQLFPHWDVVRYLDSRVPWPYPDDGALAYVRDQALPAMAAGHEWHWMIRLREEPSPCIGSISLYDQPGNNRGFWLAPQWQGKGYMREACEVINVFWFETLGRPTMRVPKAVGNHASRRISEHEGMRLVATAQGDFVCGTLPKDIWEMTRENWLASTASPDPQRPGGLQ
ncbi:GNAT family N-acetyltransferase [Pseudomonas fluorescens]|nr:GNAT family N-acetyltransferase [Pseudomonas fluorescens]